MSPSTVRVRTRPPSSTQQQQQQQQKYRRSYSSIQVDDQTSSEFSSKNSTEMSQDGEAEAEKLCGNRVMVVVDSSMEAKAALHWALSHTIQSQDTVILLHVVTRPSVQGGNIDHQVNQRAYKLLSSMKNLCQVHKPGVQVEILVKEGKEKGSTIVQQAKHEKVSLLVLGKRKRSIMWLVQKMWTGKRKRICSSTCSATDYCVQNAKCMTVAVRKKGRNHGGYLITTKRHKDFWLLA